MSVNDCFDFLQIFAVVMQCKNLELLRYLYSDRKRLRYDKIKILFTIFPVSFSFNAGKKLVLDSPVSNPLRKIMRKFSLMNSVPLRKMILKATG